MSNSTFVHGVKTAQPLQRRWVVFLSPFFQPPANSFSEQLLSHRAGGTLFSIQ